MGGLRVEATDRREDVVGITLAGLPTTGVQTLFQVVGPHRLHVWLASIEWCGGEREVRLLRRHSAPLVNEHLLGRPRIGIETCGDGFLSMDLELAIPPDSETGSLHPTSEYELDMAARTCIRCALQSAGATAMGTRQVLLGICDDRRHQLCTTFPQEARRVPAVAFVLTRLAPLVHRDLRERA